ncbi:MAG: hypothetical protein EBE86_025800 [Hormoscilla sp. GUM202]|nr:hypothetical protein [Hormoscilla sp. GUM202]
MKRLYFLLLWVVCWTPQGLAWEYGESFWADRSGASQLCKGEANGRNRTIYDNVPPVSLDIRDLIYYHITDVK